MTPGSFSFSLLEIAFLNTLSQPPGKCTVHQQVLPLTMEPLTLAALALTDTTAPAKSYLHPKYLPPCLHC